MDQSVLVDAYVHKCPEVHHVPDRAAEHHSGLQVRDLLDTRGERGCLELGPRITSWLLELADDVRDGRQSETFVGEVGGIQYPERSTVADDSEKKARRVSVKSRSVRDQMWSAIIALRCSTPVQRMRTMRSDAPVTTEVSSTSGTDCLSRTLQCGSGVFQ